MGPESLPWTLLTHWVPNVGNLPNSFGRLAPTKRRIESYLPIVTKDLWDSSGSNWRPCLLAKLVALFGGETYGAIQYYLDQIAANEVAEVATLGEVVAAAGSGQIEAVRLLRRVLDDEIFLNTLLPTDIASLREEFDLRRRKFRWIGAIKRHFLAAA